MGVKIDRVGEENYNKFGSKIIIIEYRKWNDIDVYFPEYDWTSKNRNYGDFKNGEIRCPYEKRYYGVGYLGEGKYKVSENGEVTRCYKTWYHMLTRCYSDKYKKKKPTYEDCKVYEELLNFQNFAKWDSENYYEIEGETMCLDKDILVKHNKIYSPETCVYVPNTINVLFTKSDKIRGNTPIGVNEQKNKFKAQCSVYDFENKKKKRIYLGLYETPEQAFEVYKKFKEKYIKQVADYYKDKIPQRLYQALSNYEVEITD